MAKNDENGRSYSDVENEARNLLKKLSTQYDADTVSREKKMVDTMSEIPFEDDSDERLSTSEFDKIFEKYADDEPENQTDEKPKEDFSGESDDTQASDKDYVPEQLSFDIGTEPQQESSEYEYDDDGIPFNSSYKYEGDAEEELPEETEEEQTEIIDDEENIAVEEIPEELIEEPVEELIEEPVEELIEEPVEKLPEESYTEAEEEPVVEQAAFAAAFAAAHSDDREDLDAREDTNIFADRMAGEETINSFKPSEQLKIDTSEQEIEDQENETEISVEPENTDEIEYVDDTEKSNPETIDPSESLMMKAFGLDPRNEIEKDDSKKIFNEYTFGSTDDIEDVPGMNTTDTIELPKDIKEVSEESEDEQELGESDKEKEDTSFEYSDPSQKKDVFGVLRQKYMSAKVRMIVAGLFAVLLFVIEALPTIVPAVDIFQGNAFVSVIVDFCILICCGAIVFGQIGKSLRLLTKGKFSGDTVTLCSFIVSFVMSVIAIVAVYLGNSMTLFNFAFAICAFLSILFEFLSLRRDVYTFKIVSASETKSVITKLNRIERYAEEKEFGEYMGDYSDVYKVEETDFVGDFFKKRKEVPSSTKAVAFLLPVAVVLAIVAGIISAFVLGNDVYQSLSHGFMAYWFITPVTALISFVYPMYLASLRAYSYSSAIIGDATPEGSEKISVITFNDNDAFPPEKTKIKSVKVFENNHIENVIYFASSVFSKVGGPLATVFKQATLNSVNSENVDINEITDTGIDATVEGRHIVIGIPSYMESQCFETMYEPGDEDYEGRTNKRVLYLACDEVVVAKFYIQYNVSADFLYIVRHLCSEGICVSIRSLDPCIDNEILFKNKIDPSEYPVRIIKGQEMGTKRESISSTIGSIVSTGSKKGLIKTLLLCDKLMNIRKTNLVVKIAAMVIGAAVAGVLLATVGNISSAYPALYQLFWMLPIFFISKIYI